METVEKILRNARLVDDFGVMFNEEFRKIAPLYCPYNQQTNIASDVYLFDEFKASICVEAYNTLSELAVDPDDFSSDIPSLKKRIKYCKNPLERKSLERQLNAAYKEMKKRG